MSRPTRVLCDDICFGEAPRWRQGRLWFSDFFAHAVKSISLAGDLRPEVEMDDQPSGLGCVPDGSLLIVSMMKRQLLRHSADDKITVHAAMSRIADFHCNDIVVDAEGRAYEGEFGFDLPQEMTTHCSRKVARLSRRSTRTCPVMHVCSAATTAALCSCSRQPHLRMTTGPHR